MHLLLNHQPADAGQVPPTLLRVCARLKALIAGVLDASNSALLIELEQGYREIAEHESKMRRRYPEAYAEADRQLRKRYIHLDAEEASGRQLTPRRLRRHDREKPE